MPEKLLPPKVLTPDDDSWIQQTIEDGWPPVTTTEELNQPPIIANSILIGQTFNRYPTPHAPPQIRRSEITAAIDNNTGQTHFSPTRPSSRLTPTDHSELPRHQARQHYPIETDGPRRLRTVRKSRTSKNAFSQKTIYQARGGNPDYKIKKTGGFFTQFPFGRS